MAYKIEWTDEALNDVGSVIYYLRTEWSDNIAEDFVKLIQRRLQSLADEPMLGVASTKYKAVRSIVVTKHNKLYYTIIGNAVVVLNIFDTRQDPAKNKY